MTDDPVSYAAWRSTMHQWLYAIDGLSRQGWDSEKLTHDEWDDRVSRLTPDELERGREIRRLWSRRSFLNGIDDRLPEEQAELDQIDVQLRAYGVCP